MNLTATALPASAAARVDLSEVPAADGTAVTVNRSDTNGTRPVRNTAPVVAGVASVVDYEPALGSAVTYTATVALEAASATVTVNSATPWLAHPNRPPDALPVLVQRDDQRRRASGSTVHEPIGRSLPAVTVAPMRARTGTLVLRCTGWGDAQAIENLYDDGWPLLLRQPCLPGGDHYHVPLTLELTPAADADWSGPWLATVEYATVAAPVGTAVGGRGWTYLDLEAEHATYADARAGFATYAAMRAGPPE